MFYLTLNAEHWKWCVRNKKNKKWVIHANTVTDCLINDDSAKSSQTQIICQYSQLQPKATSTFHNPLNKPPAHDCRALCVHALHVVIDSKPTAWHQEHSSCKFLKNGKLFSDDKMCVWQIFPVIETKKRSRYLSCMLSSVPGMKECHANSWKKFKL